jgi:hypothetical protein
VSLVLARRVFPPFECLGSFVQSVVVSPRPWFRRPWVVGLSVAAVVAGSVTAVVLAGRGGGRARTPDLDATSDAVLATAVARVHHHRVHLLAKDSERSTTFVNPNGTFSAELTTQPVRVRSGHDWVAPDPTLLSGADGSIRPRAALVDATLSGGGSVPFLTAKLGRGTIAYAWPTALPRPVLTASRATYPEVMPGVDLTVDLAVVGMHTSLVVKRRPTAPLGRLDFPFVLKGLTAAAVAGGVVIKDGTGAVVGQGEAPLAWDSSIGVHSGGPVDRPLLNSLVRVSNSAVESSWVQRVQAPSELLDDPKTVYPVVIDPPMSVTFGSPSAAYVDSQYPAESYNPTWDANRLHVGKNPAGGGVTRTYLQFAQSGLAGKHILGATLATNEVYAYSCTPKYVRLGTASQWSNSPPISWNNQPTIGSVLASANIAYGYSSSCPAVANTPGFNVTSAVTGQLGQGRSTFGFALYAQDETDATAWKKFSTTASLTVTYNSYPNVPSALAFSSPPAGCVGAGGAWPMLNNAVQALYLSAYVSDPDPANSYGNFRVASVSTGHTVWSGNSASAPDGQQEIPVPSGTLADGNYSWQVTGMDDQGDSSAASASCYFKIKNTPPLAPVIKMNGSPVYTPTAINAKTANPATVQFAPGGANDGVTKYAYSFDGTPPVNPPPGAAGGYFVPLAGRLMDTRNGTGGYGTKMVGGAWRSLPVAGALGVPTSGVAAVEISVTAVDPPNSGTISVSANGPSPAGGTALVYGWGTTGPLSNTAVVGLGADGKIAIRSDDALNVIVDLQGYYTQTAAGTPGGFQPVSQARIIDTRFGLGRGGTVARLAAGSATDFTVTGSANVPVGASAVFLGFTVISYSASDGGFLTPYASGTTRPATSLNFSPQAAIVIGATVPLDATTGKFTLYVGGSVQPIDVIVDVEGYFSATNDNGAFTPMTGTGTRAFDSRIAPNVALRPNSRVKVPLAGLAGVPAVNAQGVAAVAANYQVLSSAATGYIRVWSDDQPEPVTSVVDFGPGDVLTNLATLRPGSDGMVWVANRSNGTINVVVDLQGWYSTPSKLSEVSADAAGNASATITFPDGVSTLSVWAFDGAGNVSPTSRVTFTVYRDGDPSATGHGWLTDFDPAHPGTDPPQHPGAAPTTASDSTLTAAQDPTVSNTPDSLTLTGATWVEAAPFGPATAGNRTVWGLHFNGAQQASTSKPDGLYVDTSNGFTVAAWIKPGAASSSGESTAVSQDLPGGSGFTLGTDPNGHWRFCLRADPAVVAQADCVTSAQAMVAPEGPAPDTVAQADRWTFVLGYWDKDHARLRLVISPNGADTRFYSTQTDHALYPPRAAGKLVLGRDLTGTTNSHYLTGDLAAVVIFQGVRGVPGNDLRIAQLLDMASPNLIPHPVR